MEHCVEKSIPSQLNFILICQDFTSPSTLRLYLESKGCIVIQQDDTIVGMGSTVPSMSVKNLAADEHASSSFAMCRNVQIHAYLHGPDDRGHGWPVGSPANGVRQQAYVQSVNNREDREENLCVTFVKAKQFADTPSPIHYQFFEEALAHVKKAYIQNRRPAYSPVTPLVREENKPLKPSFHLTAREHEILKWVSEGKGCWETGTILGISERTVKFHLQNVYRKLNVVNRAQAISKAMRYSLI